MNELNSNNILLFELPNHKIIFIYNCNRHITSRINTIRVNGENIIKLSSNTCIVSEEPIQSIEKVDSKKEFDGYKYDGVMYSKVEMEEYVNSLVMSFDDGVPICNSQENYIKYRNIIQNRESVYKDYDVYTEVSFVIKTLPINDVEFCEPCYYTNFDKYDLYNFNPHNFAIYKATEIGKKYGYEPGNDNDKNKENKWLMSSSGWKYFKIGDKYVDLERFISNQTFQGDLETINKKKEFIEERLETEFKKQYLLKIELDKKTVSYANVIYTVDDCLNKLKRVKSSSNRSADTINDCIKMLTKLNEQLLKCGSAV